MAGRRIDAQPDPRMTPQQDAGRRTLIQEGIARRRRNTRIELALSSLFLTGVLAIGAYAWLTEQLETSADVNSQNNIRPAVTAPAPAIFAPLPAATFALTETAEAAENPTAILIPTPEPPLTWTPIPTPTPTEIPATFTPTPTPTDTAISEPTVEPTETQNYIDSRYPSCSTGLYVADQLASPRKAVTREDDGTKLPTGLSWEVGNYSNTYYDATAVFSCIDNIDRVADPIFGDGAITMDIVFYDVNGNEHRYPARTNGYSYNNKPIYLLPFQLYSEDGGQDSTVGNVRKKLLDKNGAQAETVLMTADRTDLWIGSGPINLHREFLDLLIKAVSTGRNFPKPPQDDFRIQVLALAIY